MVGSLLLAMLWAAAVATQSAAAPERPELSCPKGLIVHRYAPSSSGAKILRTRTGVELRATQPLLTISDSMVQDAAISKLYQYNSPEERARQTPSKTRFWVTLRLNRTGSIQVEKVMPGKQDAELVVACNDAVLIARALGKGRVEGIDVLIDDTAEAAEQFARSFTSNIRWEQRTPSAQ
jgi:hypothetical protein